MIFFIREVLGWFNVPEYASIHCFSQQSSNNTTGWYNKRANELMEAAVTEMDPGKRAKLTAEVRDIVLDDAPYIFICQPDFQIAMRSNVIGYVAQNTELTHFWLMDKK